VAAADLQPLLVLGEAGPWLGLRVQGQTCLCHQLVEVAREGGVGLVQCQAWGVLQEQQGLLL
jgi:hypothetical protein